MYRGAKAGVAKMSSRSCKGKWAEKYQDGAAAVRQEVEASSYGDKLYHFHVGMDCPFTEEE